MMRSLLLPFVALALWAPHALALLYTISNNCGQPINLYINGVNEGSLGINGVTTRQFANNWSGFIYTDANGGDGATGARITRAGFYGESNYYYIVIDTTRLNTGVRIEPQVPINNGFCAPDMCDNGACNSVYQFPPTDFSPPTSTPPSPPLFACPGNNVGYKVTFCPSGGFPPALDDNPVAIHPNGNTAKCLDVRGNVLANGTPVQM
ncbi:hypothetical protein H0H81_011487 [Sphagnurus paluster]|uniref:Thaumatin-like protein n=1 Tax=Sphagnurus paluster TaxID=117069 RepID=A0A9P7GHF5_9AGAR|nr:hypothetical protein H0H81_011487 [Sphagnurus paluster]